MGTKHRFLSMHGEVEGMSERLKNFYEKGEYKDFQHRYLDDTEYMPEPMYVDFDVIDDLENPDFTEEFLGEGWLEFANLIADLEADPEGYDCYAHLAIHPQTTKVYLMEPSGDPELIGEDLDAFLARLKE
jgi:hypothetical protein